MKDTKFEFTVGSKNTNLLSVAYDWMNKTLKEHGIGAKTSVGYGYFEENIDLESTIKNV